MGMHHTIGPDIDDVAYDTDGAAEYIGCSAGYLRKLRQTGEGPTFHRLFRRKGIKYRRGDLNKWMATRRFESTTEYPECLP
jgi:hypothetical protein